MELVGLVRYPNVRPLYWMERKLTTDLLALRWRKVSGPIEDGIEVLYVLLSTESQKHHRLTHHVIAACEDVCHLLPLAMIPQWIEEDLDGNCDLAELSSRTYTSPTYDNTREV
jgi:hypothetical protein